MGEKNIWWEEDDTLVVARHSEHGSSLVAINRSYQAQNLSNTLTWAGLAEGTYIDLLSEQIYTSDGETLSFTIPAQGSMILVHQN